MAIIYTYPVKTTPNANDLILISDSQDSNKTKQVKISTLPGGSGSGVSSVTSANNAITVADATTTPVLTSIAYSGGTNIGHVPTGGSNTTFLRGDGTWVVPTNTTDITLTTTGTSGAATWNGTTLNIPQYSGGGTPDTPLNSVQFNNAGAFGGSSSLLFSNNKLSVTYAIDVKGDGTNAGKINLYCQNTTTPHAVTIEGPDHNNASPYTLKLPSLAPTSNQILEYQDSTNNLRWINTPTSGTTYFAGDGLGLSGSTFSADVKENGGITIESAKLALDLGGSSITGTLAIADGGTGSSQAEYCDLTTNVTGILPVSNGGTGVNTLGANRLILGNGANAVTSLSSQTKGTIVVGDGATTNILSVGTDGHVLTAASAEATGVRWTAIDASSITGSINLTTQVTGTLPIGSGGTGLTTASAGTITRGNGTNALIADSYLEYEGAAKTLKIRGSGNTAPSLSCTLAIDDAQGTTDKEACIGLTPTGVQGVKGMHIDMGAYTTGIQIYRNHTYASTAMSFVQQVSANAQVGSITMTDSVTNYNTTSDYRLKENVVDMTSAVDRVKQLKPKRFNFTSEPTKVVDGFLAHEAQAIVPESVIGTKDEVDDNGNAVYQGIDQAKLVPLLVGAIKELTARIEALEA